MRTICRCESSPCFFYLRLRPPLPGRDGKKRTLATLAGKRFRRDLLLFDAPSRHLRPGHDDNTWFPSIQPWRERGNFRSSTGACIPVRNRDVGTVLLIRHAGAARYLHGQVSVCLAARRGGDWPCEL